MAKSVTMHYSTHWHSYRHYSNPFTVNMTCSIHSSSGHPRLCLCQLSWHFTAEFGRKWMAKSVTMHYSTHWHSYRYYSNSFRVNNKIGINSSSGHPIICLCQVSWHFTVEFGRKLTAKSVTMHYSTHWHSYRHYSNSFTVNMTFSIHSSSGWPWLCLCQLSLGFAVEFGRKLMAKSVTIHYSTLWHLYRHYSNSFRVNMTFSIHSSSGWPWLCLC